MAKIVPYIVTAILVAISYFVGGNTIPDSLKLVTDRAALKEYCAQVLEGDAGKPATIEVQPVSE